MNDSRPRPLRAVLIGVAVGSALLVFTVLVVGEHNPLRFVDWANLRWDGLQAVDWNDVKRFVLVPTFIGGLLGAVVGSAVWVTRTPRSVPGALLVICWLLLGIVGGNLLAVGTFLALHFAGQMSVGRDGSGAAGLAVVMLFMVVCATVIGAIVGIIVGVKKVQARNRNVDVNPRP